jgi:hypothetical protein
MNCIISVWLGSYGGSTLYGLLRMHSMSGLCCIGIFVFGYYNYMGVAILELCFLVVGHLIF